ncbi:histidine phosphatase family protein [Acetobacter malorum]|uniref:Phosphoglycerate mutase n=1 Tax=Acetobacter malorum TaxID=178901 RepID=A0A1Y3G381_9PROT|nr:histidine phosphatase family protein [Acetobacter malorum]OUJ04277.1 hypothetical protein HK23_09745 [Acetobacter malorum]
MTTPPETQTIRLVCLTSTLPDAVKQGRIPPREAQTVTRTPAGPEGFTLPQLRKPPRFTQIILAGDCTCEGLSSPLPVPEQITTPANLSSQSAALSPAPQVDDASQKPHFPAELPVIRTASLQDRNYGTWHGQALRGLPPDALNGLLHDPDFAPPEGESLRQFHARISSWLNTVSQGGETDAAPDAGPLSNGSHSGRQPGPASGTQSGTSARTVLLIARPAVVRALATRILQGGPDMATRLDIAPQTTSLFTHHAGNWRVRMLGAP